VATTSLGQVDPAGLVAYYEFEDSGYTTAADSAGSNTATVNPVAGGSFGAGGIAGQAWITADDGGTWASQQSDYLTVFTPDVKFEGASAFALTGWFKISVLNIGGADDGTGNNHFFDTDRGAANNGYRVSMIAGHGGQDPNFTFTTKDTASSSITIDSPEGHDAWLLNTWYFFAASYDGATGTVYLAPENEPWVTRHQASAPFGTAPGAGSADLFLGRMGPAGAFNGLRDEFSLWGRALAESEAQAIFEAGVAGNGLSTLLQPPTPPVITAVDTGSDTALEFPSQTGETYQVEWTTDTIFTAIPQRYTGTGGTIQAFDPDGFDTGKTYRVRIE